MTDKQRSESIIQYINSRPALSIRAIERECEMPNSALWQAVKGYRSRIPDNHLDRLEEYLSLYGYVK